MNTGLISTRYASALLDFAIESGQEKEVYGRMKTLSEVYLQVPQLRIALANSAISRRNNILVCHQCHIPQLRRLVYAAFCKARLGKQIKLLFVIWEELASTDKRD